MRAVKLSTASSANTHTRTYRVCLIFPVVEVMAVVENVFVGGVQTGFHAVLHHLARPGGTLQLLDLNTNVTKNICLNPFHLKYIQTHKRSLSRWLSRWEFNHKLTERHKLYQNTLTP